MVEFLQSLIEKSNQSLDEISVRGTKFHTSIKFIYSEKATIFFEISTFFWLVLVALSEYMNLN